jgi:hypothetical protein
LKRSGSQIFFNKERAEINHPFITATFKIKVYLKEGLFVYQMDYHHVLVSTDNQIFQDPCTEYISCCKKGKIPPPSEKIYNVSIYLARQNILIGVTFFWTRKPEFQ